MPSDRHLCHAINCKTPAPRRMLMCAKHWHMLSNADQEAVWAQYVPGQEKNWDLVSAEYIDVAMDIIQRLAKREADA